MSERDGTGIALLIDGENIGAAYAGRIILALRNFGRVRIGNVYLDLLRPQSSEWCRRLPLLPLEPVMTAVSETGRNSSDISLLIDAVKIAHTSDIGIFCICSSDGDFTGLARYLRRCGKCAIIVGDACKAPVSLRVSCDRFIHIRELGSIREDMAEQAAGECGAPPAFRGEERHAEASEDSVADDRDSQGEGDEPRGLPPSAAAVPQGTDPEPAGSGAPRKVPAGNAPDEEKALCLMADYAGGIVLDILRKAGSGGIGTAPLQQRLRHRLPGFSVKRLGFRRFADFLVTLRGVRIVSSGDGRSTAVAG